MEKRLYLSETDKKISGVCGGIGEYFNIDSTLIRLAWVILSLVFSAGIGGLIVYIIAAIIIPKRLQDI
jgi:phage shock protein C